MTFIAPVHVAPVAPPRIHGLGAEPSSQPVAREGAFTTEGATVVASRRTPMSSGAIRGALSEAHRRMHGRPMPPRMLDILSAHVAHETARGERMFNFNFGGIKGAGPTGLTARYGTTEVLEGESTKIVDGFRAYRSATEGAMDYLKLLEGRYSSAVDEAQRGDVAGFSTALKRSGYYTADVADYTRAMQAHVHEQNGHRGHVAAPQGLPLRAPAPLHEVAVRSTVRAPAAPNIAALGGGHYLYGRELMNEGMRLDGIAGADLPTSLEVARVVDAMNSLGARIGAPSEGPSGSTDEETRG